jgi:hypothetical protein
VPALFTSSTRHNNVYFHYPWSEEDEVTIELPAGFILDGTDAPVPFRSGDISAYKASIQASKDQRTLIYKRSFFFGGNNAIPLFPASGYNSLKQFFDRLYQADNQTITLKQGTAAAAAPDK